eukprot:gene7318-biopygen21035
MAAAAPLAGGRVEWFVLDNGATEVGVPCDANDTRGPCPPPSTTPPADGILRVGVGQHPPREDERAQNGAQERHRRRADGAAVQQGVPKRMASGGKATGDGGGSKNLWDTSLELSLRPLRKQKEHNHTVVQERHGLWEVLFFHRTAMAIDLGRLTVQGWDAPLQRIHGK